MLTYISAINPSYVRHLGGKWCYKLQLSCRVTACEIVFQDISVMLKMLIWFQMFFSHSAQTNYRHHTHANIDTWCITSSVNKFYTILKSVRNRQGDVGWGQRLFVKFLFDLSRRDWHEEQNVWFIKESPKISLPNEWIRSGFHFFSKRSVGCPIYLWLMDHLVLGRIYFQELNFLQVLVCDCTIF